MPHRTMTLILQMDLPDTIADLEAAEKIIQAIILFQLETQAFTPQGEVVCGRLFAQDVPAQVFSGWPGSVHAHEQLAAQTPNPADLIPHLEAYQRGELSASDFPPVSARQDSIEN